MFASTPPSQTAQRASHRTGNIILGTVLILILITAAGAASSQSRSTTNGGLSDPLITVPVASSGSVTPVNAGNYTYFEFALTNQSTSWTITGSFTATNDVTAYIMNSSESSAFASGSSFNYYYTTGNVMSAVINAKVVMCGAGVELCPTGTYYLVFDNTNLSGKSNVTITQSIVASGSMV